MTQRSHFFVAFMAVRWIAILSLFGYGIFAGRSWAIAAGKVVTVASLLYSALSTAARASRQR